MRCHRWYGAATASVLCAAALVAAHAVAQDERMPGVPEGWLRVVDASPDATATRLGSRLPGAPRLDARAVPLAPLVGTMLELRDGVMLDGAATIELASGVVRFGDGARGRLLPDGGAVVLDLNQGAARVDAAAAAVDLTGPASARILPDGQVEVLTGEVQLARRARPGVPAAPGVPEAPFDAAALEALSIAAQRFVEEHADPRTLHDVPVANVGTGQPPVSPSQAFR